MVAVERLVVVVKQFRQRFGLLGWVAAVFLLGAWLDHDDDLAEYRWPIDDEDGDR